MEYKKLKFEALDKFRKKDYVSALGLYESLIKLLNDEPDIMSAPENKDEMRNALNPALVSIYNILNVNFSEELLERFEFYMKQYLNIAMKISSAEVKTWAVNIFVDLFDYSIRLQLINITQNFNPILQQEKLLSLKIREKCEQFINILCRENAFDRSIIFDKFLDILYFERRNVNRLGHSGQNYLNTYWLANVFLEIVESSEKTAVLRASVMNLLSDIALFAPEKDINPVRFNKEKLALDWLDRSLSEDPDNIYAQQKKMQLIAFMTSAEQINRFRHDAISKIESIRGLFKKIREMNLSDVDLEDIVKIDSHIDFILSSFRLTQKEKPFIRKVDIKKLFMQFNEPRLNFYFTGTVSPIKSDQGYLSLIIQNLIQNALEAYGENSTEKIFVSFNYDNKTFFIKDFAGGIPENLLQNNKLFEPYSSTKGIHQNAGLGLANVAEACRLINAEISCNVFTEGIKKGTEFYVKLNDMPED